MSENITSFLNSRGFKDFEGYSQQVPQQIQDLIALTNKPDIKVMEIGFNAGHSAEIFLQNNKTLTLTSFDIGQLGYVKHAKEYIDTIYPNRHELIIGNSVTAVPAYSLKNKNTKFDVIFIDGGHDYPIANADLNNCFSLAHKDTIVILDDTMFKKGWGAPHTIGPTRTWMEHIQKKTIIGYNKKDYSPGRGMVWGKYVM